MATASSRDKSGKPLGDSHQQSVSLAARSALDRLGDQVSTSVGLATSGDNIALTDSNRLLAMLSWQKTSKMSGPEWH